MNRRTTTAGKNCESRTNSAKAINMESKKKKKFAEDFASGILRVFARLLKEFGPEFLMPVRVGEYRSYFSGDQYGFALVVSDFHHQEKTFQGHEGGYFMIRATKPEPRHGKS